MSAGSSTNRESVRHLGQSILNRLENKKLIEFSAANRQKLRDAVYALLSPSILTEADLRDKTLARLGENADALDAEGFADSDRFRAAKKITKEGFGDDELNGFYFQKTPRQVSHEIVKFLLSSDLVEEVYASDEEIERITIETFQSFNPANSA